MVGIGLLFAYSALAQPNNREITTFYKSEFLPYEAIYNIYYPDTGDFVQQNEVKPQTFQQTSLNLCSCVLYLEQKYGFNIGSIGQAKNWPINSQTPEVGEVVITSESNLGHVAKIMDIREGNLILDESNYSKCQHTTGRKLPIDSPLIKGYWKP